MLGNGDGQKVRAVLPLVFFFFYSGRYINGDHRGPVACTLGFHGAAISSSSLIPVRSM